MNTIPTITEEDIRDFVGERNFQLGQDYFSSQAIFSPRRQGMTLTAQCRGSQAYAYRVRATFDSEGIADATCSCPVGEYCKHSAALLLTWLHQPNKFLEHQDVDTILKGLSNAELISLIKKMLRREPDFESLVLTARQQSTSVNIQQYRRQIKNALRRDRGGYDYDEWDDEEDYGIPAEVLDIKDTADELVRQGDYASAVAIYDILVTETIENYSRGQDGYEDEAGELSDFISDCIDELDKCLANVNDPTLREQILRIFFTAFSYDLEGYSVGVDEWVPKIIMKHATAEERRIVASWISDVLAKKKVEYGAGWQTEQYGRLLLELQADTLDDETFLRICRETGRTTDLVDRLLKLRRIDEALQATQHVSDYQLIELANLFVKYGHDALAERMIRERVTQPHDMHMETQFIEWLRQHYLARNTLEPALEVTRELFRKSPSLSHYQEVRTIAKKLGRWEMLRSELLALVDKSQNTHLLIEIALDEGDIDTALERLKEFGRVERRLGYSYYNYSPIELDVARAAEETQPHAAIAIYQKQAESLIDIRGRENYREASRLLVKVRDLYQKLGENEQWTNYVTDLRERNRTLRALKEEMAAAGL